MNRRILRFVTLAFVAVLCAAMLFAQSLPQGVMFTAESTAVGTQITNTVPFDVLKVSGAATQTITTNGTAVGAGTCQAQPTLSLTNVATSSVLLWSTSAALPATWQTGIAVVPDVSTSGTAKLWLCNGTAGSITPAALVLNVRAIN